MKHSVSTAVGVVLACCLVLGAAVGYNVVNPIPSQDVKLVSYSLKPSVNCHIWGCTVTFNKDATELIAGGSFSAAAFNLPAGPVGWAVAAALGVGGIAAEQALAHGNCLEVVVPAAPVGSYWLWRAHC